MVVCKTVGSERENQYNNTFAETNAELGSRLLDFITRHYLTNQFFDEDEQSKR